MKRGKISVYAIKYIMYILGLVLLFLGIYWFCLNKYKMDELSSSLDENEVLIDYTIEEPLAYTLVNKKGITEYGDFFVVFERTDKGFVRIYENDFKELMPWKIKVADIDGDENKEVLIAVKKSTYYDEEIKNRMFVFNYQEDILVKKWTGSQIAGRWRDFYVGDLLALAGDELIFVQQLDDGKERISIHSWYDFGFIMIAYSDDYDRIKDINIVEENCLEIIYNTLEDEKNEQKKTHYLEAVDGRLLIKED